MLRDVSGLLNLTAALGAVLGLIGLAGSVARRTGLAKVRAMGQRLEVEDVLPVGPRHRVCLIRFGHRRVAVLIGGPTDLVLGCLDERDQSP